MRKWIPDIHDPILTDMVLKWRRTDREIADEMGFDIQTVGHYRQRLDLERVIRPNVAVRAYSPEPKPPKEKPNPIGAAMAYLGTRLVEKPSGYWLDGRPVNLPDIMRETNRIRVKMGLEQIGPEKWRTG